MGINIGICETEAPSAPCRELRANIVKVHLDDPSGFEEYMEYDTKVDLDTAKKAVGDWDAFIKRNRINPETDAVYMDKVKKDDDRATLEPLAQRVCTGWIVTEGLPDDVREKVLAKAGADDRLTGWDMLSFDEMNDMCANCPLSWDKGRGCIGAFGPDNSLLPEIAGRHGCPIVASVPDAGRRGAPEGGRRAEGGPPGGGQDDGQTLQRPGRQDGGRGQDIRVRRMRVLLLLTNLFRLRRSR